MNANYAERVQAKRDKLLGAGFIRSVKSASWLSPIVMVPKTNGQLHVCVDYRKLNAQTMDDPFPLPFTDAILDTVADYELYNFLDGFSRYNQLWLALEDWKKTAFATD